MYVYRCDEIEFPPYHLFRLKQILHNMYSNGKNITIFILDRINSITFVL